jgi:eukaryotic-like serine/threonine-protein kinase
MYTAALMTLASGTRIGVYDIRGLLGEGGMGQVYRARDTRLDRDVGVKVLPELFARDGALPRTAQIGLRFAF